MLALHTALGRAPLYCWGREDCRALPAVVAPLWRACRRAGGAQGRTIGRSAHSGVMGSTERKYDYDFAVLGGGSGGVRAARIAAKHGAKVVVFEESKWGGTCVNVGCVPKKLFVYASRFSHVPQDSRSFGWEFKEPQFKWRTLLENKNREIGRLNGIYEKMLGECDTVHEHVSFGEDSHTLVAGGREYTSEYVLIATGSSAFVPDFPGKEHVIVSDDCFYLEELPRRVLINGGGYIGVEFSHIFNGLGVEVTHVYRGEHLLRGFDVECASIVCDEMKKNGIDLRLKVNVNSIEKNDDGSLTSHLTDGTSVVTDKVLYATGRWPSVGKLGLDRVGVETGKKGAVKVNEWCRSSVPNVYAIGDVIDKKPLTPVAINEGHAVADTLFGNKPRKISYKDIPTAVFSTPTLGTVGLTEEEAREEYGDKLDVYKTSFRPMKHTLDKADALTFYKLLVDRPTDAVVGAHVVDMDASELIQVVGILVLNGCTKAQWDATIAVHPTSAEELVTLREPERNGEAK